MNEIHQNQKKQVRFHGIGQQLNKNMQLHMLRCVLQLFFSIPGSNFAKLSNPKGKWTSFMKHQLQPLGGSFNGIWMDASGQIISWEISQSLILPLAREELQFFEHFAPKNTGFPVGCTPSKESHMWERSHIGENSWVSGGSGFWWWTIW